MPKTKTETGEETLHLEALPKAVKRALRAVDPGLVVVECRASDPTQGEHGKTTLVLQHALDPAELGVALNLISKQANVEQDLLLRDDEEDA